MGLRAFGLGLAAGLALAMGLALPEAAPAQPREINPCSFSPHDSPCEIEDGLYRALVPQNPGPHPAVVYLYGSLGRSNLITDSRYFRREVVNRGFALIVPGALQVDYPGGERGTGWGRRLRRNHPRDDLDFLARVIADARKRFNIDPERVIFAGQSDGGYLIWEIACHRPDMGTAFAVHAASYGGALPARCRRPVKFLQSHGTRDEVVPISGEERQGPWIVSADLRDALGLLARTNGCGTDPRPGGRFHGFDRTRWDGCADGAALDFLVHDGGHDWPLSWMPAVLDWFAEATFVPAEAATRRVGGDRPEGFRRSAGDAGLGTDTATEATGTVAGSRFQRPAEGTRGFQSVPKP
ncbi:MAG: alpha/beta hydrolase family esterase [Paracoccaceae bacterium]